MLVPGETFVERLIEYLKQHDVELLQGVIALRLQPRALDYAASRLRSLTELQAAASSPLKDVTASEVKGVGDYLRLEKLAQLLAHVRCLKIESARPGLRDPTRISVEPFMSLTSLELRGCDLSTANWDGLPLLQGNLRELRVHDTLEALHHLLAPHAVAVTPAGMEEQPTWKALRAFECSHNCISAMDPSLRLLPALQRLELSHSNLPTVANLGSCTALTSLNLSHNRIHSLSGLREVGGSLRALSLQWNCLRGTEGVETLTGLRSLDLGYNFVAVIGEVVRLSGLRELTSLQLAGNPVSYARSYRCDCLSCFPLPQQHALRLDGAPANPHERQRLKRRAAGSGGRIAQICRSGSLPDEAERPWLKGDGQAWSRLVDEVLGPTKPFVARDDESPWAYLGSGRGSSSAGASAASSPRSSGGGGGGGSPRKAPPWGRQRHSADAAIAASTASTAAAASVSAPHAWQSNPDFAADVMVRRWTGGPPAAPDAAQDRDHGGAASPSGYGGSRAGADGSSGGSRRVSRAGSMRQEMCLLPTAGRNKPDQRRASAAEHVSDGDSGDDPGGGPASGRAAKQVARLQQEMSLLPASARRSASS